jgi:hypothetical protein
MNEELLKLLGQFFADTQVPRSMGAFRRGAFYDQIEETWDAVRADIHAFGWLSAEETTVLFRKALAEDVTSCKAMLWHGPGHQSNTPCQIKGPHIIHEAVYNGQYTTWRGDKGMTGVFDEPPMETE